MKIGILTYHHAHNYGAYLQACALCNRLNLEKDIEAEIIDYRMRREVRFYDYRKTSTVKRLLRPGKYAFSRRLFDTFERALNDPIMKRSAKSLVSDSFDDLRREFDGKYDVIIAGSDEIWKLDSYRGFPSPYWLPGEMQCRKFSYAASARNDPEKQSPEVLEKVRRYAEDFEYLGVRDRKTEALLVRAGIPKERVHVQCDPSFLMDVKPEKKPMHEVLSGKARIDPNKKTIALMTNDRGLAFSIFRWFGRSYNLVSVFDSHPGWRNVPDLTPTEWLSVIRNSDLFMTTYFHGTCFSVIFGTPFVSFGSKTRSSKIEELFTDADEELRQHYIPDTAAFLKLPDAKTRLVSLMKPVDSTAYVERSRQAFDQVLKALRGS